MRRLSTFLFLLIVCSFTASAQIADDFLDGNFSANPVWQGETSEFIVNANGELQLFAPDAGNSLLMSQGNIPDSVIWQMIVRMEFAPSASNYLRIWLQASDNSNTADGYFLELGENGSLDAVRFYRQQGGSTTLLATGLAGEVAGDPVNIRLEMRRAANGNWQLLLAQGGGALVSQFTVNDVTIAGGDQQWFGFYCLYSATRKDKFYFDNISVLPDLPDLQAPVLLSAIASDNQTVVIAFDEILDSLSAVKIAAYTVDGNINPTQAIWQGTAPNTVKLIFANAFQNGLNYTLAVLGVKDVLGNEGALQETDFSSLFAEPSAEFDILINEIMADPSPSAGLPATAEWIELYNRSGKYIQLSSLKITDGGGLSKNLPDFMLLPGKYLVLCTPLAKLSMVGIPVEILAMTDFPSLNNDGETLSLNNEQGDLIDQVAFSPDWHTESSKKDGGWSLERINSNLVCLGRDNWQSCPQPPGGSPGAVNFSNSTAPDNTAPYPVQVSLVDVQTIAVVFSEGLDVSTATNPANYALFPTTGIAAANVAVANRSEIRLTLGSPLQPGILYSLYFPQALADCTGNQVSKTDTLKLGIAQQPAPSDIVISEILFNPATGGSRFVEVYNNSNKIFDLSSFYLANYYLGVDIEQVTTNRLFLPGEYMVFSPSPVDIVTRFAKVDANKVIGQLLPSLDDKSDNISLYWSQSGQYILMDSFNYSSAYHNALLSITEQEGVSLERIRITGATNDRANWTSAAGKGTPTRPNSQRGASIVSSDVVTLSSAKISPDGDSYEDYLDIFFQLPDRGYSANMTIYDSEGLPVKQLLQQQITGVAGALRWDGDSDDGSQVRPGIYILFLEIFSATGDLQQVKKTFAVVGKL
jgi:hypothetical protein